MKPTALILAAMMTVASAGAALAQALDTSSLEAFGQSMKEVGATMSAEDGQALMISMIAYAAGNPDAEHWFEEMKKVTDDQSLFLERIQPLNGMNVEQIRAAVK